MEWNEFSSLPPDEANDILKTLPEEDIRDLHDQRPFMLRGAEENLQDRQYFDTIEELHEYILKHHVPSSKPWRAREIASHELAHAECALALGAIGVRYYALANPNPHLSPTIYTEYYGPVSLPNLAFAAVTMHPHDAVRSPVDMENIYTYGYASRGQVIDRIAQWNQRDDRLLIPEPQIAPSTAYP